MSLAQPEVSDKIRKSTQIKDTEKNKYLESCISTAKANNIVPINKNELNFLTLVAIPDSIKNKIAQMEQLESTQEKCEDSQNFAIVSEYLRYIRKNKLVNDEQIICLIEDKNKIHIAILDKIKYIGKGKKPKVIMIHYE